MDKGVAPGLFVNDGSFMERFKQLQQEKVKDKTSAADESTPSKGASGTLTPNLASGKTIAELKANDARKVTASSSGGKLAFSLKQKSKIVAPPVKLGVDEDEDEAGSGNFSADAPTKRQKLGQSDALEESSGQVDVAPYTPSDSTVKIVADKLANFVAKHGRQFEHITRQKNPGDTPFKFLFDESCADYKYYEYQLAIEEKAYNNTRDLETSHNGGASMSASKSTSSSQRSTSKHPSYQTPASALYDDASEGRMGELTAPNSADPIAMMEYYVKKAAHEERKRQPKQSKDEMPPPASLQAASLKKGHHMGDYIPQEELDRFMAACNDAASQKAAKAAADRAKIQADNVGHKLLSKMGWKEGEGLGSSRRGISDPIMAGNVKKDNLGVGAQQPGEVTPEDDIYEQYKKRMMLGYRYRPNPLNNPRKAYY